MKNLSLVRFASYIVCIALLLVATSQRKPHTTFTWWYGESDALRLHESAAKLATSIPKQRGFKHTQMSGSRIVAAATAAAKLPDGEMEKYGEPQITLRQKGDRLVWDVGFYLVGGPPGAFFEVEVDDQTGSTKTSGGI
jgi:hypothetical protein